MKKDYSKYDFDKFDKEKKWNLYIDADTIIYSAAAACSKGKCIVTKKSNRKRREFENFDEFINFFNTHPSCKDSEISDFEIPLIRFALSNVRDKIDSILDHDWIGKYTFYVGGKGNFRKDIYPDYKCNRPPKPEMHKFCYEYLLKRHKGNVVICDGVEAEDYCQADAMLDEFGIVAYCDKDLENQEGFRLNYNRLEEGVFYINKLQAFYNLCIQLIIGDRTTDNIRGVDFISNNLKEKYNIRVKSLGVGTAQKLLDDVKDDIQIMKERIVDIYKLSYGDNWKESLDFTGKLIFIMKERDVQFSVDKFISEGYNID